LLFSADTTHPSGVDSAPKSGSGFDGKTGTVRAEVPDAVGAAELRAGTKWCESCFTLLGRERLSKQWELLDEVRASGVAGSFVET